MKTKTLALQWYQPAEFIVLKRWLIYSIFINLLIMTVDITRDQIEGLYLTSASVFGLVILRLFFFGIFSQWKYWMMLLTSIIALSTSILAFQDSTFSYYSLWASSWLIIPLIFTLTALGMSSIRSWGKKSFCDKKAQEGLERNNALLDKYNSIGAHIILLHGVLTVLLPIIWIVDISISPGNALGGLIGDAFSLEHFSYMLNNSSFYLWLKNSVVISVGTVVISLFFAIPAGYAFSRYDFRGRNQSMKLFLLVQMFPGAIILVPYFMVMKTLGLLNSSIGLIIIYSVSALPISVWMLKGYFDTIPRELEEAAMLDGCNQFQVFYRVVLPLSITAISVTALIAFLAAWNEFLLALVFNSASDMFTLPVGLVSLIPATGQRWGDFAAASVLVSLPVVLLFIYFQKSLISGMSAGSVKG